jgi:hypothetical protein
MFISVLYVGNDAPDDWIPIECHASMAVLSFDDFKIFAKSHSGKIFACPELAACPEVAGADHAVWLAWLETHNCVAGQCQNWELG